jgi:hypothetical protein
MGSFLHRHLCLPILMPTPVLAPMPAPTRPASLFAWPRAGTLSWMLGAAALCVALAPGQAVAQAASSGASQAVSPAETLLFETDHLARIKPPAVLVYEFRKVSNVEPGFSDKVRLDLAGSKGKTSATLHFLSGAHKHDIPALEDAHGNPVLLGFLERDIAEMKRLTGGSTAYFRKRIRMALAEDAHISAQSVSYQGKSLPAQAVRIQPYLNDPLHVRFEPYVHKTYTFVVSDGVPGGIVQVRSSLDNGSGRAVADASAKGAPVAGKAPGDAAPAPRPAGPLPAIDETLTFVSVAQPGQ